MAVAWARGGGAGQGRALPLPPLPLTGPGAPAVRDVMGASLAAPVTVGNQPIYLLAPTRAALVRTLGADQSQELDTR